MTGAAVTDGTEIIGRYVLHGKIASGGMAVVHFGRLLGAVGFSRPVAIKRLHPQLARDPSVRAMFIDEARVVSRIQHPNVVPTLDVVADGGALLLVMEYVHGESLQQLLAASRKRGERVPLRITLAIMTAVLHGLHAAHEATSETGEPLGVVHRDISPQNVMVGVDGVARVLDFGIARATVRLESTREGIVKGKLAYMAPEQMGGGVVDRRADVYAAAVVLWEMLTGTRLFVRNDAGTVMLDRLLGGTIEPPSKFAPGSPRLLDAIVLHGLARVADQRFATAREMALALERLGEMALASEIGDWVESLVAAKLAERAVRLKQLETTSATHRVEAPQAIAPADRPPPPLFGDDDVQRDSLLDRLFPADEGLTQGPREYGQSTELPPLHGLPPSEHEPPALTSQTVSSMTPMAQPDSIAVPPAARRAPHALAVFAAYAVLGFAIVLLAGVLRWTRSEGAVATPPPAACPVGMTRIPGDDASAVAPFCLDVAPPPSGFNCRAHGKRAPTPAERDVAGRPIADTRPALAALPRCRPACRVALGRGLRHVGLVAARNTLGLEVDESGLFFRALGLWLNPKGAVPAAFASHAHVPRAVLESGRVLASQETVVLAEALAAPERASKDAKATETLGWDDAVELPVDRAFGGGTARLSIVPAGHVLGGAQLVVDHPGGRIVYSGDWSRHGDATHPAGVATPCDELVVTTTFGLPIFRFDPPSTVLASVVDWCASRLAQGVTPIVLARSPGPAQAIARALSARGLPVSGDEDVRRACAAYEALGVVLGPLRAHDEHASERSRVVVATAAARATELRSRGRVEIAYASGWALLDAAVEQKRADAAFALADQADFDGLVALVRATGAQRIVATRGEAKPFAGLLRGMGLDAHFLELLPIDERGAS